METEVSLDLLETLIEGGNRHVAETWMDILEDQLTKFSVAKHHEEDEAEEDEPSEPLKNFAGLGHLLWWTLSSVKKFNDDDPEFLAANIFVPWHSAIDDFLCLMDERRDKQSLRVLLKIVEGEFDNYGEFEDEENPHFREEVIDFLESEGADEMALELEKGCYLYAAMIALVSYQTIEEATAKWKEIYHLKVLEMTEVVKQSIHLYHNSIDPVLLPFTARQVLFAETRNVWDQSVEQRMAADKKTYVKIFLLSFKNLFFYRYDIENDRTNIESDFQCPKCGSFKTVYVNFLLHSFYKNSHFFNRYYPLQMRSADEPMAVLWECNGCNKSGVQK